MNPASLELTITVLIGAVVLDFVFGDPRRYLNPVTLIRRVSTFFETFFRTYNHRIAAGAFFAIFISALFAIPFTGLLILVSRVLIIQAIVGIILFKGLFSVTSLSDKVNPIITSLESGAVEDAAVYASHIVKRDLSGQDSPHIASAVIETISNTLLNEVVSPLFYFSVLGIIGSLVARVVDILDGMVGQKNRRNFYFGHWPAVFHTILNYVPARVSAFLILLGSEFLNYRVSNVPFKAMRLATDSPGEGWVIGAMAASLNLRMERVGHYVMNESGFDPSVGDIRRAMRVYYVSFYVMLVLVALPIILLLYFGGFYPLN